MQSDQLSDLQKYSHYISSCLGTIKEQIVNDYQLSQATDKDPSQHFQQTINLRAAFRSLADGIQANRMLVQLQKQKIQKSKVFLQGLQYYKTTLKAKIGDSNVELIEVKDYLDEPSETLDWVVDYKEQQEKLVNELKKIKEKKTIYQEKIKEKDRMAKLLENTKQKYQKTFPQQIKKLISAVVQTTNVFNIQQVGVLEQIQDIQLEQIHSLLYTLKIQGKIQLNYSKSSYEQLQVVINKCGHKLYKIAQANSVSIEEKPLKFVITALNLTDIKNSKKLVISVSRRQDFTTEEVFSRLFMNETLKPVYSEPQNELQRNLNNKYSFATWIARLLVGGLIQGSLFVQKIKERIFSLQLQKHLCENSKKLSYFFPLYSSQENYESPVKKVYFSKFEKINFQDYFKCFPFPSWLEKALNNSKIYQEQHKNQNHSNFLDHDPLKNYRKQLDDFIQSNSLEEIQQTNVYNYYKFQLKLLKDLLTGVLIVPITYPKSSSKVRLLSYKKEDEKIGQLPKQIPLLSQVNLQNQRGYCRMLLQMQEEVNQKIHDFFSNLSGKKGLTGQSQKQLINQCMPLLMVMQINRMICYFAGKYSEA